jgi:hypothetical protein
MKPPKTLNPTERHLRYWERMGGPSVFISYRSGVEDDVDLAQLLYNDAAMSYGREAIFLASRSIPPATKFSPIINAALKQSVLFVPIIGKEWAGSLLPTDTQKGHPWVVHEVATALRMGKIVLPVMAINNHRIPGDVPPEICEISDYQTINCSLEDGDDFMPRVKEIVLRMGFLAPNLLDKPMHFNYLAADSTFGNQNHA